VVVGPTRALLKKDLLLNPGAARALHEAEQEQQDAGTDRRDDQTPDQSAAGRYAERAEEETAKQRADDAYDNISDDTEPAALHELPCQPSGSQPDQYEPQEFHFVFLLGELNKHPESPRVHVYDPRRM
jgi:hypothetical protein